MNGRPSSATTAAARLALRGFGILLLVVAGGCATRAPVQDDPVASDPAVRECAKWYAALDAQVDSAGMRDVQTRRVAGFPYLRVDRYYASLREVARVDERVMEALVERLVALDISARTHEIANLPVENLALLWQDLGDPERSASLRRTRECGRLLRRDDMARPARRSALLANLFVPDDYVEAYRVFGLYWLARIPFSIGVRAQVDAMREAFRRDLAGTAQGTLVRYSPPSRPRVTREQLRGILARSSYNALRQPEPGHEDLETLFAHFAPSFEIDTTGDHDRFGALRWRWGMRPEVDVAAPTVYRQSAFTRYRGVSLLQLVYTIWFPERPPESAVDLLAGKLDGVVFRVTLAPDGQPLVYDSIHPCGCYHLFVTTPRALPISPPDNEPEWAFVPQQLAADEASSRLVVRVATRSHYVQRVIADRQDSLARYEFLEYDELRSLPLMSGGTRSVFDADGFIAGTERPERLLFWPMGIANAGAMRQWGRHPTAFIGRRHFDDADLFERRFVLDLN